MTMKPESVEQLLTEQQVQNKLKLELTQSEISLQHHVTNG